MEKCQVVLRELFNADHGIMTAIAHAVFMANARSPWSELDYAEASDWLHIRARLYRRLIIEMEVE